MLDYLIAVFLIGLAVNRTVEVWWHSALFWKPRLAFKMKLFSFPFSGALTCPFCFSVHVGLWFSAYTIYAFSLSWWALPLLALGSTYVANMLNDVLPSKTPRENYKEDLALAEGEASGSEAAK